MAWVISSLLLFGSLIMLVGSVGILRMPDLYSRMQATTKSMTLGLACILLATVFQFGEVGVGIRSALIIAFYVLTAPVAAHMIGRAAYFTGVPLWRGTAINDLKDRYNRETHDLSSGDEAPEEGIGS